MGNVTSSLSDTMRDIKQDPSDVLGSLLAHGRNVAASLSNTAIGASPLIANLLESFRKYWHKVLALLPISRKSLHSAFLSITIKLSTEENIISLVASWCIPFTAVIALLWLLVGFGRAGIRRSKLLLLEIFDP